MAVVEQEAGRHRGVLGERAAERARAASSPSTARRVEADGFGEAAGEPRHLRVGRTAREEDVDTAWIREVVGDGLAQQRGLAEPGARDERDHTDFEPAAHVPEQARPREQGDLSRRRADHCPTLLPCPLPPVGITRCPPSRRPASRPLAPKPLDTARGIREGDLPMADAGEHPLTDRAAVRADSYGEAWAGFLDDWAALNGSVPDPDLLDRLEASARREPVAARSSSASAPDSSRSRSPPRRRRRRDRRVGRDARASARERDRSADRRRARRLHRLRSGRDVRPRLLLLVVVVLPADGGGPGPLPASRSRATSTPTVSSSSPRTCTTTRGTTQTVGSR